MFTTVFMPSSSVEASTAVPTVEESAIIGPALIGSRSIPGITILLAVKSIAVVTVEVEYEPALVVRVAWHSAILSSRPGQAAIIVAGYWFE